MRNSIPIIVLLSLISTALMPVLTPFQTARAAQEGGIQIFGVEQNDLDGDNRPDMTIIDCAFATAHDRIVVIDQKENMFDSKDWRVATDFSDDIWMYDINADGSMQLIVEYAPEDGHDTANVYDDQNGDSRVDYERTLRDVRITESTYFTARFESGSHWLLPDGRPNLNLRIFLDGPIPTLDRVPKAYVDGWMKHDGLFDIEFEEAAAADGIAQYAVKRLLTASPADWGFERARLQSNEGRFPTGQYERAFFPFLPIPIDPQDPQHLNLRYFDLPPSVNVDWERGKILGAGLDGYPIGEGYHFNDNMYILKDQVNDVAFESPQAYYDLAGNHDGFAEMHIRFFTHPPDDRTMWSYPEMEAIPWQSISYDWNLFNPESLRWDFKVGLGGNYTIDSVINFPDFAVRMVPFKELPYWITDQPWKMATFVAREGEGYQSSEGIYEWQTDSGDDPEAQPERALIAREATGAYMLGLTPDPPDEFFQQAHPGFRADWHLHSPVQPFLYFSLIDHKLHLKGAEAGVWNIDGKSEIRYANLKGGDTLDGWQYFKGKDLLRQFYASSSYLIYAGEDGLWLKLASPNPSLFETLPPRSQAEWADMRQKLMRQELAQDPARQELAPDSSETDPGDFKAMLDAFEGDEWHVTRASVRDFRMDNAGFQFVLDLASGFQVTGAQGAFLRSLEPGSYLLSYRGFFNITPLTAPTLSASLLPVKLLQYQPSIFSVVLENHGLEDLPPSVLELWATSPTGESSVVVTQTVTLLAQTPVTSTLQWAPTAAGDWMLTPKIVQEDENLLTGPPVEFSVLPAQPVQAGSLVLASTSPKILPVLVILLIMVAAAAAVALWQQWGKPYA